MGNEMTNNAALGYAMKAMLLSDMPKSSMAAVLDEMKWAMDMLTPEEAARLYEKSEF